MYDFSNLNVAIADDSAFFRTSLRSVLYGFGIRDIFEAEDGKQCLTMVEKLRPDILFLDWEMPEMSGLQVMRDIRREDGPHPFLPVIMVTSHTELDRVQQATTLGIHELLCKPIAAKPVYQRLVSIVTNPRKFVRTASYFGPMPRNGKLPVDESPPDIIKEDGDAFIL